MRLEVLLLGAIAPTAKSICTSETRIFHVKVDLFASEVGYFTFEECGEETNPTLGLEVGQMYTFVQTDPSNYYHPLGFAYFPDGAHDDKIELEPTVSWQSAGLGSGENATDDTCAAMASCPAPLYYESDSLLGDCSDLTECFGLEEYEQLFFHPVTEWNAKNFSIRLRFDDETYEQDIFYFCHIHQFMSGRIKLLRDGVPISDDDEPPIPYSYDEPGDFDMTCGTYGLDDYQLPNSECQSQFVCGADEAARESIQQSAPCYDAFNCAMMAGMTTGAQSGSEIALFIHHMIPHHQNAVNMAKTLLKLGGLACDDLLDEEATDCIMTNMMRDTINSQNQQIQAMRQILATLGLPEKDDCLVTVTSSEGEQNGTSAIYSTSSGPIATAKPVGWGILALLCGIVLP